MSDRPRETSFPALAPRVGSEFRASLLQIPLFGDENLLIQAVNIHPTTPVEVVLTGRLWSDETRELRFWQERMTCPADGGGGTRFVVLERGALLTLRVSCDTGGIGAGNVWTRVVLQKGFPPGGLQFAGTIVQAYVSSFQDVSWPGMPLGFLREGQGAIRQLNWNIVSGTSLNLTVPASRRWRVITGRVFMGTSGVAGVRNAQLTITVNGIPIYASDSTPGHPAATGVFYNLTPDISSNAVALSNNNPLPFLSDLELRAGDVITVSINAALAGDALTANGVLLREWFDP